MKLTLIFICTVIGAVCLSVADANPVEAPVEGEILDRPVVEEAIEDLEGSEQRFYGRNRFRYGRPYYGRPYYGRPYRRPGGFIAVRGPLGGGLVIGRGYGRRPYRPYYYG